MALKHDWTKQEEYLISSLNKHLFEETVCTEWFYSTSIQHGMILMMEHLQLEVDLPLTWQKICKRRTKETRPNFELLVGQAASTIFTGKKYVLSGTVFDQVTKLFFALDFNDYRFKYVPCSNLPCEFVKPAQEGDLAKLTFLLDVAVDRPSAEESLAIFLLNERRYDLIMNLCGVKEQLAQIPQKYIKEHWVKMTPDCKGDWDFLHYTYSLIEDKTDLIYTVNQLGKLSQKIEIFLENGFSPDSLILDRSGIKISLRQYLYFLDEIKESAETLREYGFEKIRKTLPAVKKLVSFERKG